MRAHDRVRIDAVTLGEVTARITEQLQRAAAAAARDAARDAARVEARREARELVAAVFAQPRFWPSLAADRSLTDEELGALAEATRRRLAGAPLAYAARSAAFRHLNLFVDERVLIPRPETERLVDLVLARSPGRSGAVAVDVGTGSGAIALALATEGPFRRVVATDVSTDALEVARRNATRVGIPPQVTVEFRTGDALAPVRDLTGQIDVLVANPPYIAFSEAPELPALVRDWEPPEALTCPDDGLSVTRSIVTGAGPLMRGGGLMALEVDARRASRVAALVTATTGWEEVHVARDLTGRERFVLAVWRGPERENPPPSRH